MFCRDERRMARRMYSSVKRDSSTPLAAAASPPSGDNRRRSSRRSSSSPPQQWRTSGIFVPNVERDMKTNRKVGIQIGADLCSN